MLDPPARKEQIYDMGFFLISCIEEKLWYCDAKCGRAKNHQKSSFFFVYDLDLEWTEKWQRWHALKRGKMGFLLSAILLARISEYPCWEKQCAFPIKIT